MEMHYRSASSIPVLLTVCLTLASYGCGTATLKPELAGVTGSVTLDGKPLSGASISFIPKTSDAHGNGRSSSGVTDDQGKYALSFSQQEKGALIGEHTVQISKLAGTPEVPGEELVPSRYNTNSELAATVSEASPNNFDFPLKSNGKK